MDKHRGDQAPPLSGSKALRQGREFYVLTMNIEADKGQCAQGGQVVTQLRNHRHDDADQQDHSGGRAGLQLLGKAGAAHRRRAFGNRDLVIRVAQRELLIQSAHIASNLGGRPQHLLARLFADPMGHLHALEQRHKARKVDRNR